MSGSTERIVDDLERYPLIDRYMRALVVERLSLPDPRSSRLLRLFCDPALSPDPVEDLLRQTEGVPNLAQIFEVRLGADPEPDEKINDVIAEVRALRHLIYARRFEHVAVVPRGEGGTVDFTGACTRCSFAVEVKHPRGPEFKHHRAVQGTGAYRLDQQQNVANAVRRLVTQGLRQISRFRADNPGPDYQGIVLLAATRVDVSMFYVDAVESAIDEVLGGPSGGLDLPAIASVDYLDYNGDVRYHPNARWAMRGTVDIWPRDTAPT